MFRALCCAGLVFWTGSSFLRAADPPAEVKTALDLIPINSAAGFAIHNLDELKDKGDAFIKNTGTTQEFQRHFGFRPSALFAMAFQFLQINKGRDDSQPAGIFLANLIEARVVTPFENDEFLDLLVVAVAFDDRDEMASNFHLKKGELQPGKIVKVTNQFGTLVYVRGNHLYLGRNERAILSVAKGKPLSQVLTAKQRERVARSDMLLHLGTTPWGPSWAKLVQDEKARAKKMKDQEVDPETGLSAEVLGLIADCLPNIQNILVAAAIDEEGFEFNFQTIFRPGEHPAARKLLDLLRSGEEPYALDGLPLGDVIAAQAVQSDGVRNLALVRGLSRFAFNFWNDKKLFDLAKRPNFVGLFDEVWQRLQGSRLAVYRNKHSADGLFSMVAILDTDDPEEFLKEMRQLAQFASPGELKLDGEQAQADDVATVEKLIKELGDPNFRVRQSATLKLSLIGPPAVPYLDKALKSKDAEVVAQARRIRLRIKGSIEARHEDVFSQTLLENLSVRWGDFPKAESRQGLAVDILKMDLDEKSERAASKLRHAFGPDWSKIRIAVKDKHIVVLLGSNTDLFEAALANLKKSRPGLFEQPRLAEFHRRAPPGRRAEFHINLQQFSEATPEAPATPDVTSLSLGVEKDAIELHLWVPNREFRTLSRFR